ncbi:acetylxylan esterase [Amycolatopsis sp. cmx-11-51]|uniref:poly(ethylene terephthalate) hydrolase family protein n=1 Tax=Amycolatopsis sp. cmx-11-51 TaxID=2785797 RepID=UPI0039E2971B
MRKHIMSVLSVALAFVLAAPAAPAQAAPTSVTDSYWAPGPHTTIKLRGGPDHTFYYPSDLTAGSRHPVILWGNGTGATPDAYDFLLQHLASWGFVVAAANTKNAGSGSEMLAGARFLIEESKRPESRFYQTIDEKEVGATGHSQGGGGAIVAGADPMVTVTAPIQPGPQGDVRTLRGPSLLVAGQTDTIVPSVYVRARYYQAAQIPAVFAELRNSDHFFSNGGAKRLVGAMTAWFRYWLADDQQAAPLFFGPRASCGLCRQKDSWSTVERNTKARQIQSE